MLGPNYDSNYPDDSQGYDAPPLPYVPYTANPQSTEPMSPVEPHQDSEDPATPKSPAEPYVEPPAFLPDAEQFTAPVPVTETVPVILQKKSRRGLWIALISIFALLVIGSASTFALVTYINRSTPVKTLDAFCHALQKEDYQTAYNQFSKQLQGQFTEGDFAGLLSQDKVTSCTHGNTGEGGNQASTSLKLVHNSQGVNNDKVMMKKGADNIWKIDDLQKAS